MSKHPRISEKAYRFLTELERDRGIAKRTQSLRKLFTAIQRGELVEIDGWGTRITVYEGEKKVMFFEIKEIERPEGCTCEDLLKTTNQCAIHYTPF